MVSTLFLELSQLIERCLLHGVTPSLSISYSHHAKFQIIIMITVIITFFLFYKRRRLKALPILNSINHKNDLCPRRYPLSHLSFASLCKKHVTQILTCVWVCVWGCKNFIINNFDQKKIRNFYCNV